MGVVSGFVRSRVGAVAIGAVLLSGGIGVAAAATATPNPEPAAVTVPEGTPAAATTTAPAATTPAGPAAVAPSADTPVATVPAMTTPAPQPVPAPAPTPAPAPQVDQPVVELPDPNDPSVGSVGDDGNYTMAPQQQLPGGPPVGEQGSPEPAAPLPGETGYVG